MDNIDDIEPLKEIIEKYDKDKLIQIIKMKRTILIFIFILNLKE